MFDVYFRTALPPQRLGVRMLWRLSTRKSAQIISSTIVRMLSRPSTEISVTSSTRQFARTWRRPGTRTSVNTRRCTRRCAATATVTPPSGTGQSAGGQGDQGDQGDQGGPGHGPSSLCSSPRAPRPRPKPPAPPRRWRSPSPGLKLRPRLTLCRRRDQDQLSHLGSGFQIPASELRDLPPRLPAPASECPGLLSVLLDPGHAGWWPTGSRWRPAGMFPAMTRCASRSPSSDSCPSVRRRSKCCVRRCPTSRRCSAASSPTARCVYSRRRGRG